MAFTFSPLKHFTSVYVNTRHDTERKYVQRFTRPFINRGWTQDESADGYFTRCLLVSPDGKSVMKISGGTYDGETHVRDAFNDFVLWAITQTTPHLPKIYRVGSLRKFNLFVTVMERLERLPRTINSEMWAACPEYRKYEIPEGTKNRELLVLLKLNSMQHDHNKDISTATKQLSFSLGRFVKKMVDTLGWPNDLHSGNIMLRGNTPVILDPYSRLSYQKMIGGKIVADNSNRF